MLRKNYEADWERKKRYLIRTMFEEPPALSPIRESTEPTSRCASPDAATDLPELIIERVPKRRNGESALFYHHLRKRMRKYYRKLFNVRTDETSSSGTEFDEAIYDEYNPEYTIVTHEDDLNVTYVIAEFDKDLRDKSTLYLGSASPRKDSSEKERAGTSETFSGNDERQVEASGSKEIDSDLIESFICRGENNVTNSTKSSPNDSRAINFRLSEELVEIHQIGLSKSLNIEPNIMQEPNISDDDIILPTTSTAVEVEEEQRKSSVEPFVERVRESVKKHKEPGKTVVDSSHKKTNKDGDARQYEESGDMEGKEIEYQRHSEEKSGNDEMGSEEESEQLGDSQEEGEEEEEESQSKEESGKTESTSDQLSGRQEIEEEEEAEEENSDYMEEEIEEVEIMRSYIPEPSKDSLLHEPISDTEENTSLNLTTHRHSLPQDLNTSVEDTVAPEEMDAADDNDEFHPMLRTSTPRKSKRHTLKAGTKRSFEPAQGDGIPAAKKRTFKTISLQTDEMLRTEKQKYVKNISTQTDCKIRHFGVQTEERRRESENVGTQTDLQQGAENRNIETQVSLHKEHRSIEIQTERNQVGFNTVEMQTEETQREQQDAESQANLGQEGVDIGIQTDERADGESRPEDNFQEFFERRAVFFFFF